MPVSRSHSKPYVPGLDARAIRAYAVPHDARFVKGALDSPIERTPRGVAKSMARRADVSDRVLKAASRVRRLQNLAAFDRSSEFI